MTQPDRASFQVHLDSLLSFANELQAQVDALVAPLHRLTGLTAKPIALGEFAEATSLRDRHQAAVGQVRDLLVGVQEAVSFADEVTQTIATGYKEHDARAHDGYYDAWGNWNSGWNHGWDNNWNNSWWAQDHGHGHGHGHGGGPPKSGM